MDKYSIPKHLDDPELFGFWTIDEFIVMILPFLWGIIAGHVVIGVLLGCVAWFAYRKVKSGRDLAWIIHAGYWHLPAEFFGLKAMPPSHLRILAG
jgi:conjugal transfer pilus assembly protein TraL